MRGILVWAWRLTGRRRRPPSAIAVTAARGPLLRKAPAASSSEGAEAPASAPLDPVPGHRIRLAYDEALPVRQFGPDEICRYLAHQNVAGQARQQEDQKDGNERYKYVSRDEPVAQPPNSFAQHPAYEPDERDGTHHDG